MVENVKVNGNFVELEPGVSLNRAIHEIVIAVQQLNAKIIELQSEVQILQQELKALKPEPKFDTIANLIIEREEKG